MRGLIPRGLVNPGGFVLLGASFLIMIQDALGVECYKCTYLPFNGESQGACSDPWPWYRETFPDLAPPREQCEHSCRKIIIYNRNSRSSVVRDCGPPCTTVQNKTISDTTVSTCCEGDLCNGTGNTRWTLTLVTSLVTFTLWTMSAFRR